MEEKNQVELVLEISKRDGVYVNPGYIYILKADNGLYKIGKSKNVRERIKNIKTASPVKVEIFRIFYSSNMDMSERMLHAYFSEFREIGEWFKLENEEIEELNNREGDHLLTHCYL